MKRLLLITAGGFAVLALLLVGGAAVFADQVTDVLIHAGRSASGLETKSVGVDGKTWHYLEGGPRDTDPLVLLHGFNGNKDNWTPFAGGLTESHRVIIPDLPGFGDSERDLQGDYSLATQRDQLRSFLHAIEIDRMHIAGHSMGGYLSVLYVQAYSDSAASLALIASSGVTAPEKSELELALSRGENPLLVESVDDFDTLMAFATHEPPPIPWPVKGVLAQRALQRTEFTRYAFEIIVKDVVVGLEPVLDGLELPIFVLWGRNDRIAHVSTVDVLATLMPQTRAVIMEETGHLPIMEKPAEASAHYLAFLEGL